MIDCRILLKNSTIHALKIQQIRFKSHLVVVGAGWGGFRLATDVDKNKYDVTGKSLSEALLFAEHVVYKNCSECQKQFLYTTCSHQV